MHGSIPAEMAGALVVEAWFNCLRHQNSAKLPNLSNYSQSHLELRVKLEE